MKKSDFDYEADASGYKIYYKYRCIGGRPSKEKAKPGYPGSMMKRDNIERAELDIHLILKGRGDPSYVEMIEKYDAAFERWRKR